MAKDNTVWIQLTKTEANALMVMLDSETNGSTLPDQLLVAVSLSVSLCNRWNHTVT